MSIIIIPNSVCDCILGWWSVMYLFWGHCDLDLILRILVAEAFLLYYWGRNPKFGVWMHLRMGICCLPLWGHCDLDLRPSFKNSLISKISPILFEVGITNLVCDLFLGWRIGAYHFVVTFTLTLTSDLFLSPHFFKKSVGDIAITSMRPSVCPSITLSPPKPLDEIQPNLVCELLTWIGRTAAHFLAPPPRALGRGQKFKYH